MEAGASGRHSEGGPSERGENEKIRINDISLPLGGYFDINGDWRGDHVSHRTGKDVDIENVTNKNNLKRIFEKRGWDFVNESGNAFPHFRY